MAIINFADFVATVSLLHWEKDAVFRPRPNLPRSSGSLSSRGLLLPGRMALIKSFSLIPQPSSFIDMDEFSPFQKNFNQTFFAPAVMLLSIRSEIEVGRSYPKARSDSI